MFIIGAGMAGLLAAHYFRHHQPTVLEKANSLPDNHGALLRFRSRAIMDITGAPLREVRVRKAIMEPDGSLTDKCTLLHSNEYSHKVTGFISNRSIENLEPVNRWVAEPDFLKRMACGVKINFNSEIKASRAITELSPIISTIPMKLWTDSMCLEVDYKSTAITSIQTRLDNVDVHQTVYMPRLEQHDPLQLAYRGSLVGNVLILECIGADHIEGEVIRDMLNLFCVRVLGHKPHNGDISIKVQKLGKIVPLPSDLRRHIIGKITEDFGVYSIGRFATWRQILLDDVVNDLKVVERLMSSGNYARQLHYAGAQTNA